MPKALAYTLAWSPSKELYELYETRTGRRLGILPDSPAWFAWLDQISAFVFSGKAGHYTARREPKQRGDRYWYAYFTIGNRLTKKYLGKSADVTLAQLEHIAGILRPQSTGEQGSRDISQHAISDAPADSPPFRSIESRLQDISAPLTSLIGREREIAAVCELLQRNEVRLLTLTGTGGIGKTRLAIDVATRLAASFSDGVAFVPLAPIVHPWLVFLTIKQALGLTHQLRSHSAQHLEDLKTCLRDAHMLLVIDNFEHVLAIAPDLIDLLLACPSLKMLVTSRAVLRVEGEYEFNVPPLALPNWSYLPAIEALTQHAAVALFLERALAIKPDLALTKDNMQAIAAICVYLDGLPLAIELAAARVKLLPPQALLRQLTQAPRLAVLTGGPRNVPERQQTLRNTLAWSYNLLNQAEQRLFRLLSIFVEGCTLEAIEAVSTTVYGESPATLDILASLIDKSLLHQSEQEGAEARFVMLDTVREYALDCLHTAGEAETAWQALAVYYIRLAEQAEARAGDSEQVTWLQRLEREHENVRGVLLWLLQQGEAGGDITMALRLGAALRIFWMIRGPYGEGRVFLERALAAKGAAEKAIEARARFALANLAFVQSDFAAAETESQESLRLFRELGDQQGTAYALYLLAWVARDDITDDIALAKEALALFREIGDREYIAWSIYTLGYLDSLRGGYERAARLIEEALALQKALENTRGVVHALLTRARIHIISQGDLAKADACLDEGMLLLKELDDQEAVVIAHTFRGQSALYRGEIAQARSMFEECLIRYKKIGSLQGILYVLYYLALAIAGQGDGEAACAFYKEALAIARELGMKEWIAACLEGLAKEAVAQDKCAWAACLGGTAEALREAVHIPIPLIDRADYERALLTARTYLDEHTFAARWALGRTMTPEQALALEEQESLVQEPPLLFSPPATYPAALTAREVQVLRLVARGLTNAEIADELGLSEKTIAHHLTHIFNKTTSQNRVAAMTFAFRHGLV